MHIFERFLKPRWIQSNYKSPMRYGILQNLNTDQISYGTQASEGAFIVSQDDEGQLAVKLEILRENYEHSDENMYVAFCENESDELSMIIGANLPHHEVFVSNIVVKFELKHSYFSNLVKAVNNIPSTIIKRILPTPADFHKLTDFPIEYLDSLLPFDIPIDREDQFRALCALLSCNPKSPPIIVNGAFGTGKTRLLAVITHCVIKHGMARRTPIKVLVCAHHQASADHFVEQYFGKMFSKRKDTELVRLSVNDRGKYSPYRQFYQTIYSYINNNKPTTSKYLVIVTTFTTAPKLLKKFGAGSFTHILLDEGAQAREPEAIAPLCLAGADTKIVVTGDSHQVVYVLTLLACYACHSLLLSKPQN